MPESMRPNLVQEMLKQNFISSELEGAEYIYFEVVTQGMLVGAYWGIADKFDYPYQPVNHQVSKRKHYLSLVRKDNP